MDDPRRVAGLEAEGRRLLLEFERLVDSTAGLSNKDLAELGRRLEPEFGRVDEKLRAMTDAREGGADE